MSRSYRLAIPVLALLASACGTAQKPYNPFKVPREQFYSSLKIVALAPVRVPSDLDEPEPVKAKFAELITARLREAGFTVVAPGDVGPISDAKLAELGGLFDPVTGKADEAKAKARDAALGQVLRERFHADAFLEPSIRVVTAALVQDQARWDGATEGAGKGGLWKSMLATHSGAVRALSLVVWLTNASGEPLYAKAGGIQVLGNVNLRGEFVPVPRAELFSNEDRNVDAVRLALDPLLRAGGT